MSGSRAFGQRRERPARAVDAMTPLVLVVQLALASLSLCEGSKCIPATAQSVQACWQPTSGRYYEVWVAAPGGGEWAPYQHGVRCEDAVLCCVEGLVYDQGPTAWMVVGRVDSIGSGSPTAWSVPLVVDMRMTVGRWTSASTGIMRAPTLKAVE